MPLRREYASAAKPAPGSWVMVIDWIGRLFEPRERRQREVARHAEASAARRGGGGSRTGTGPSACAGEPILPIRSARYGLAFRGTVAAAASRRIVRQSHRHPTCPAVVASHASSRTSPPCHTAVLFIIRILPVHTLSPSQFRRYDGAIEGRSMRGRTYQPRGFTLVELPAVSKRKRGSVYAGRTARRGGHHRRPARDPDAQPRLRPPPGAGRRLPVEPPAARLGVPDVLQ